MKENVQGTRNRNMSPPVQILECPGGGGHLWPALNPRWYSETRPMLRGRHWCPEHEEERKQLWKARIAEATVARRHKYDDMGLPATRFCTNPQPTAHARGAVLPVEAFYIRTGKVRKDGTRLIRLDSQCKVCRRQQEDARRRNWTPAQRKQHSKRTIKSRRQKRKAMAKQKDPRLDIEPIKTWLAQYVNDTGITYDVIEERAGLGTATISSLLTRNERHFVSQSVVEKIAVGLDRPYLLSQLYNTDR